MYTILAKASRLSAADSGSSHFVIVSSRVTITRLQRESSSAFASHLKNIMTRSQMERVQNASLLRDYILTNASLQSWLTWKVRQQYVDGTRIFHLWAHLSPFLSLLQIQCCQDAKLQQPLEILHPAQWWWGKTKKTIKHWNTYFKNIFTNLQKLQ